MRAKRSGLPPCSFTHSSLSPIWKSQLTHLIHLPRSTIRLLLHPDSQERTVLCADQGSLTAVELVKDLLRGVLVSNPLIPFRIDAIEGSVAAIRRELVANTLVSESLGVWFGDCIEAEARCAPFSNASIIQQPQSVASTPSSSTDQDHMSLWTPSENSEGAMCGYRSNFVCSFGVEVEFSNQLGTRYLAVGLGE